MGKKLILYKVFKTHKFSSPNWKSIKKDNEANNMLPLKMKIIKTKNDEKVKKRKKKR